MRYAFIAAEKAEYPVTVLCRVLRVTRSGFYVWMKRGASARAKRLEEARLWIRRAFASSRETYGSPRLTKELHESGFVIGRNQVAREMRAMGLAARPPKRFCVTTDSNHDPAVAENLLDRKFQVAGPKQAWVTDITYVWTREGWLYLAVVLDLFARRVVGWALDTTLRTDLVRAALEMAVGRRLPAAGLLHHSDRGSQYASGDYRRRLAQLGLVCSMSRRGNCWDNAVCESFFATLKVELVYRNRWNDRATARAAIAECIECFYNPQRRYFSLGCLSPTDYEKIHDRTAA